MRISSISSCSCPIHSFNEVQIHNEKWMTYTVRLFPAASQHRPFVGKGYSLWERVASEKRGTFVMEVCSHLEVKHHKVCCMWPTSTVQMWADDLSSAPPLETSGCKSSEWMIYTGCHNEQMSWQDTRWHVFLHNELLICGNDSTSAN